MSAQDHHDPAPRVLHVDEQRTWRGGEQQMLYLAAGLHERGLATACALQPGAPAVERASAAGLVVHELPMHGELDLRAAFRLASIVRRGGYNILHAHTAHAHALAALASRVCGAPARVVAHRRIEFAVGRGWLGLSRLKYRVGVDAYIAISNRVKETLLEAGVPEWRVFVVHSVTDPERFAGVPRDPAVRAELGIPADAFVVGNIGALVDHKDHATLLQACRRVRDARPDTWVLIAGEGQLRDAIQAKARALQMDDRLVLAGFRDDVPRIIAAFDVFALSSSAEGMCSTLLEVAAAGCPIVATDAGGVREAVLPDRTGLIVPVRSPGMLSGGILALAGDPERARALARAGRQRVRRAFTPEALTEATLAVYRQLLAGRVSARHPVGYLPAD